MAGYFAESKSHEIKRLPRGYSISGRQNGILAYVHCGHCPRIAVAIERADFVR
jgi:hypothetical protein